MTLSDWRLALPLAIFFGLFFLAPLLLLVGVSFFADPQLTRPDVVQYATFFGDAFNWSVLGGTLRLGAQTVLLTALLGYPLALVYLDAGPRVRSLLVFVIVVPLLTSVIVRTFAWIVILGRDGLINRALLELGLTAAPIRLLQTELGLTLALAQIELPLMLLPLLGVMARIDPNLRDASAALGAGRWRTLGRVILPLSMPGLVAGCLLVFASASTAFVTQSVIGGGRLVYLPTYVWQQAMVVYNWPFAATISVVLLLSILAVVAILTVVGRYSRSQIHG